MQPDRTLSSSDSWAWRVDETDAASGRQTAFGFVQSLAQELSRGRIDLPTCPEAVASSVQQALDGPLSDTLVTRVISSDAALAAGLLKLANAGPAGRLRRPVNDLKLAVTRVGHDRVRSEALPYVLEKLRSAQSHARIQPELARLWNDSTRVAAIARVLAARTGAAAPDVALLAGLLHNVGGVYLVARAERHLELFRSPAVRDVLMRDWQAPIGKAIAQNWGLPDEICDAIGDQDQLDRHDAGARDLTDVLSVAVRAAAFMGRRDELEIALGALPQFRRLGLGPESLHEAMAQAAGEVQQLQAALGL